MTAEAGNWLGIRFSEMMRLRGKKNIANQQVIGTLRSCIPRGRSVKLIRFHEISGIEFCNLGLAIVQNALLMVDIFKTLTILIDSLCKC